MPETICFFQALKHLHTYGMGDGTSVDQRIFHVIPGTPERHVMSQLGRPSGRIDVPQRHMMVGLVPSGMDENHILLSWVAARELLGFLDTLLSVKQGFVHQLVHHRVVGGRFSS